MTTALITGCAGFVGSHLAEYLLENTDWDIVGMVRWNDPIDNLSGLADRINRSDRISLMYADVRDLNSVNDVLKHTRPDYVFHLAAQSFPQTSFISGADTIETNTTGTLNILNAAKEYARQAWIHICSSSEVYGRVAKENLPINEDCPFGPASPYAISKVGADMIGRLYADAYRMNVVVTRMFTHTGARRGDVFAESSFAKQIAIREPG